jgi:hypothetical protein
MAFQPFHCQWPEQVHWANGSMNGLTTNLDGSTYPIGVIFRVPKTGTLDTCEFRLSTITTAQDMNVEFRSVSESTGVPGSVDQSRTVPSASVSTGWVVPGLVTSDGTDVGTKRTVTQGELLCVSWNWPGTTGSVLFVTHFWYAGMGVYSVGNPFPAFRRASGGGSLTIKTVGDRIPTIALKYDDGTYGHIPFAYPRSNHSSTSVSLNSSPDEIGFRIKMPVTAKCVGVWGMHNGDCQFKLRLMDDASTELITPVEFETNYNQQNSGSYNWHMHFNREVTLQQNTFYRVSMEGTNAGNSFTALYNVIANTAHAEAWGTPERTWIERTNGGAWTEHTDRMWYGGLLLSAVNNS